MQKMVRVHIFVKHKRLGPISSGDFKKNEHVEDHKENNKSKVGSSVLVGNCPLRWPSLLCAELSQTQG